MCGNCKCTEGHEYAIRVARFKFIVSIDEWIVPFVSEMGCLGKDCCSAFCDLATVDSIVRSERFSELFR